MSCQVEIPEFYMALVLKKASANAATPETLGHPRGFRQASERYLLDKLQAKFPTLRSIKLGFDLLQYHSGKPQPRFDVYWQGQATADFGTEEAPSASPLMEAFLGVLGSRGFLMNVVRALQHSSMATAVEIQARRLKRPTAGGTVQAPAYFMAFRTKEEFVQEPTAMEREALIQLAQQEAYEQLEKAYPDTFQDVQVTIVKIVLNAKQPDETFQIYVEWQAVAIFTQDTPTPVEIFQVLTQCVNAEFMAGLDGIGGRLARIVQMVMRLCVIIEVPLLIPVPPADGDGEPIIITVYIEFFLALVVRYLKQMPTDEQMAIFHGTIQDFFTAILATHYPGRFVDLVLESSSQYGAGLPVARFNLLHQYSVTLQFYEGTVPDEIELITKFVQCNVPALMERLCTLPHPFNQIQEVTLGKAAEKPLTDETYSGKIEEEPQEEVAVPVSPSKSPQKKKLKKKKRMPSPPPSFPSVPPLIEVEKPKEETIIVGTSDVFVSLTLLEDDIQPSMEDFEKLAATTSDFYAKQLTKEYSKTFVDIHMTVRKTDWRCGIPSVRYQVYVEWDIKATFKVPPGFNERQSDANQHQIIPDNYYLCRSLISCLRQEYLVDYVCDLKETPFAKTCGVYTKQVVKYQK